MLRESDLDLLEELTHLKNGSWDWWNSQKEEILSAKKELAGEWGIPIEKISDGDARWRENQKKSLVAMQNSKFNELLALREDAIRILSSEEKNGQALTLIPECLALCYAGPSISEEMGYSSLVNLPNQLMSPQVSLFLTVESDLEKVKSVFFTCKSASTYCSIFKKSKHYVWACFEKEVSEYLNSLLNWHKG